MIDNDLQKRGPARRKCLIINDLCMMKFKQKEAEGFCPPPLLRFRFSLGDQLQQLFVTGFAREDLEQISVDALAILIAFIRHIASQELS